MKRPPSPGIRGTLVLLVLAILVAACGGSQAATLVTYQRTWPDGFHEELTLSDDGRITMHHGDALERLTIAAADVQRIRDALAAGVPDGASADGLVRTVILANGTTHSPVRVEPGSATGLLEQILTTHSLTGSPPASAPPAPAHSMGAHASP
jgi:hypothetical protein